MVKYSVLMSLYIEEKPEYLRQAIESMLNQTAAPDEIVVVKDGPIPSELSQVLEFFQKEYPGLFHITGYAENKGLGFALNFGLVHCRNELVARMDTDDISRPGRCEQQLKFLAEHPETDIVSGDIAEFIASPQATVGYRKLPCIHEEIAEYMKRRCALNHVAVMFKKTAVLAAGSYREWFWNEDYYLWIRMLEQGCRFGNTGTVLVDVRTGADMYSRRGGRRYFNSEIGLQKYMLKKHIIGLPTFIINCAKRLIVQVLLPNRIRGWVFRTFARAPKHNADGSEK